MFKYLIIDNNIKILVGKVQIIVLDFLDDCPEQATILNCLSRVASGVKDIGAKKLSPASAPLHHHLGGTTAVIQKPPSGRIRMRSLDEIQQILIIHMHTNPLMDVAISGLISAVASSRRKLVIGA
jgi:hypothetical protein